MESSQRVFVSSTIEDLMQHRAIVAETLRNLGLVTIDVLEAQTRISDLVQTSLLALEHADLFIGIYAARYGEILPDHYISLTELLYNQAFNRKIPRYVYIVAPTADWPLDYLHNDEHASMMKIFLDRLKEENLVRYFDTPAELSYVISLDLNNLHHTQPMPAIRSKRRQIFIGMLMVASAVAVIMVVGLQIF